MMTDRIDTREQPRMITQRGGIGTNVDPGESATVTTECEAGGGSLSGGLTPRQRRLVATGARRGAARSAGSSVRVAARAGTSGAIGTPDKAFPAIAVRADSHCGAQSSRPVEGRQDTSGATGSI